MLPEPTLRRLPWYLAYVKMLDSRHEEYVSSTQIAKRLNVDASQIAKDLSFLNIKGKTRIGYEVHPLKKELTEFLGFKHRHNAFLVGTGSLGSALMRDLGLMQYGLNIVAGFDINPEIVGKNVGDIPIYDIKELAVGADVRSDDALSIRGRNVEGSKSDVIEWIDQLNY